MASWCNETDETFTRVLAGQLNKLSLRYLQKPFPTSASPNEIKLWEKLALKQFPETLDYTTPIAGIGVQVKATQEGLLVKAVLPGFGAEKAGLKEGDLIVSVAGLGPVQPLGLAMNCFQSEVQGPVYSKVTLKIRRAQATHAVEIERNYLLP
ncbi:MAG: PDZ domain-containing protein [Acidobacteria bacterium]|nr:PDZ domain-containing protein [Acidobacteriota bacterium]